MAERRLILLSAGLIAVAGLAAYHNSFTGPFIFDDVSSIVENPSIRRLWPLSDPLSPPREAGLTVSGRPILNLSLAVNYAISGLQPWSYHVLNVLIHITAGLVLFGSIRRVLPRVAGGRGFATAPVVPKGTERVVPPYHLKVFATPVACVVTLLWMLHPLQTQAVTYVIQRAESLMGLFYLLTIYGFVRMVGAGGSRRWGAVSVGACLLGVGTKEVAVTAPLFVLLADRVFFCDSILAALRKRPLYYLALAATWLPLTGLVLSTGGDRGGTFTWSGPAFLNYWLTQPEALTRYLGLALWPHPLVFEYGVAANGNPLVVAGCTLVVLLFMALTMGLWWRRRPEALGLGAFLLVLAPTSLLPGMQIIVEHRMYLPLAGLMAVFVAATTAWLGRRGLLACAVLALLGGMMTAARNRVYQDPFLLWSDTVAKRPGSAKAQNNLGLLYHQQGNLDAAIQHYEQAVKLEPAVAQTRFNFALALRDAGRTAEAIQACTEAVRILPHFFQAHALLGVLLAKEGDAAAARHLQIAYDLNPELAEVHLGMGLLLAAEGRDTDAVHAFERALQLAPGLADARLGLGVTLAKIGRLPEASKQLQRLTEEVPALAEAHANLGIVLAESGEVEASIACYREALRLQPGHATAHYNLGNSFVRLQRWAEAKEEFETAVRLDPGFTAAREMLDRMKSVDLR